MEFLGLVILLFAVVGIVLFVRERRTGRGTIMDERAPNAPQSEADREAMRAEDLARSHASGWYHH